MRKTDKAAEIAADEYPTHEYMSSEEVECLNRLGGLLARRIRAAIKAERTRCVRVIEAWAKQSPGKRNHPLIVRDDLIALINPKQPKPKKKARKRGNLSKSPKTLGRS